MKPPHVECQKKHQENSKTRTLKNLDIISVNVCLSIFLTAPPTLVVMLSAQRNSNTFTVEYLTTRFYYYWSECMLISKMLIHMLFCKNTG